jgi:formylglycine-generating enzyme required for sulfatase activity
MKLVILAALLAGSAAVHVSAGEPAAPSAVLAAGLQAAPMAAVGPGTYRPVYPSTPDEKEVPMRAFLLDRLPVTNAQYLEFVRARPEWQRGKVPKVFADGQYLQHWAGPGDPGPSHLAQPVVNVSWFAAEAYCEARGGRLPTEAEWEFAAAADERAPDARLDPTFRRRILTWYSAPTGDELPRVGRNPPNFWGVQDLHGLAWEWVLDFGGELVAADNRDNGSPDRSQFCGSAALAANEKEDYAAFMRIAMRSSLKGRSTTRNLGFRCAGDAASP